MGHNTTALQTARNGLPILVEQTGEDDLASYEIPDQDVYDDEFKAFRIHDLKIVPRDGMFQQDDIPACMWVAIFYRNHRNEHVELMRDAMDCVLKNTLDGHIEVCLENPCVIHAKRLFVKKRNGPSIKDGITRGIAEHVITDIWFETTDVQEVWPLLGIVGSEHNNESFHTFAATLEDREFEMNDAVLRAQTEEILVSGRHKLDIDIKMPGGSFPTPFSLLFNVQGPEDDVPLSPEKIRDAPVPHSPAEILEQASPLLKREADGPRRRSNVATYNLKTLSRTSVQSPSAKIGVRMLRRDRLLNEPASSTKGQSAGFGSGLQAEPIVKKTEESRNIPSKRKREMDDEDELSDPRQGKRSLNMDGSISYRSREDLLKDRKFEGNGDDMDILVDDRKRPARSSRNTEPTYVPRKFFDKIWKGGQLEEAPARTSQRLRLIYSPPPAQKGTANAEGANSSKSPGVAKVGLVPKSRRPLYAVINRRMLIEGDELQASDDEPDDEWQVKRSIYAINDFTDVTDEEKELFIRWNLWVSKPGNACSCGKYLQRNLIKFCQENQEWFLEEGKRHRTKEMCKFWKVSFDRVKEVTQETWFECLRYS